MNDSDNKSMRESVLSAIEGGGVKMRPRWHFALQAALLLVGTVLTVFAAIYVVSFAVFSMHRSGAWFTPGFGAAGVREFILSLPWILVLLTIIFVVILEILVRQYSFAYRRPLLYSALGVITIAGLGGIAFSRSSFHDEMLIRAQKGQLPIAGRFYKGYGMNMADKITLGDIVEFKEEPNFIIIDFQGRKFMVLITPATRLPGDSHFTLGDTVAIFGERADGSIKAEGIRKIKPEPSFRQHFRLMHPPQ